MTGRPAERPAPSVVMVTGASSGIGRATAVAAAQDGFTTVATVRHPDGERALRRAAGHAGVALDVARLDVTDPESVDACLESVLSRHGGLDAVVNNAGVAGVSTTLELGTMESLRASMEANFFGVVAVSRAAIGHLRASGGRLITISSVRGVIGQPFNEEYAAAKFAVEGFMEALAPVAAAVGVAVSVVEPAAVRDTEFVTNAVANPAWSRLSPAASPTYADTFAAYRRWVATGAEEGMQTAAEVARVVVAALTDERPPFRIQTSEYARRYVSRKLADPDGREVIALTSSYLR